MQRVTMAFHGISGVSVLHPTEANPGMHFDQFWTTVGHLDANEMRAFVGLCVSRQEMTTGGYATGFLKTNFGTAMARDRFNLIWRYLHLANNDTPAAEGGKLVKIRWFVDYLNEQFQSVYETMVKFNYMLTCRPYAIFNDFLYEYIS